MSQQRQIKTAVIGLGMGRAHAYAFKESEKADLRWVVDLNRELAVEVATELGCNWSTDYKEVLDDVDAVSICLPHHLHAPVSLEVMAKGKHVLVEKPMANTEEECRAMIAAGEKAGVTLMVAFPLRYRPEYQALKDALDSAAYGDVICANGFIHTKLSPRPDSWFARADQLGGGVLFSHGCHDVDILLWLFGEPLEGYFVGTRVGTEWMEGEGTAQCLFRFPKDILASLSVSWGTPFVAPHGRLHVHTTKALLAVRGGQLIVKDAAGERALYAPEQGAPRSKGELVAGEIEHFLDCILEQRRPMTDGEEGLRSLRVIWDLYKGHGRSAQAAG